jgi:curli biogenesis system outer membrane secretion channel CsgG
MNIFIADGVNLKECCQTIVITILEVNSFESLYNYDDSMYYGSKRSSDETEDLIKNIFSNQLEDILLMNGYTVLDRNMMHDIMHEQGLSETGLSVSNQIKIGKLLNAQALVTASYNPTIKSKLIYPGPPKISSFFHDVSIKIIDVETSAVIVKIAYQGDESIGIVLSKMIEKITLL